VDFVSVVGVARNREPITRIASCGPGNQRTRDDKTSTAWVRRLYRSNAGNKIPRCLHFARGRAGHRREIENHRGTLVRIPDSVQDRIRRIARFAGPVSLGGESSHLTWYRDSPME